MLFAMLWEVWHAYAVNRESVLSSNWTNRTTCRWYGLHVPGFLATTHSNLGRSLQGYIAIKKLPPPY